MMLASTKVAPAVHAERRPDAKMLVIDADQRHFAHSALNGLPQWLHEGDVIVVNDAATLPASFRGFHSPSGQAVELRLTRRMDQRWEAVVFGSGDWRTPTELRPPPPHIEPSDVIDLGGGLRAHIANVTSDRLVELRFEGDTSDVWHLLYAQGLPIQYSYHRKPLALWDPQTIFATRPWALEPPSAALHFDWDLVLALKKRGIRVLPLTHAAGISSTGDAALDALFPRPEHYAIPNATWDAVTASSNNGGRVVAVGTSVVRALESAATSGNLVGETALLLGPGTQRRVVDSLLTGLHDTGTSHRRLIGAFADAALIDAAYNELAPRGYLDHEFGDLCLIMAGRRAGG